MKKIVCLVACLLLCLTGCGSSKATVSTVSSKENVGSENSVRASSDETGSGQVVSKSVSPKMSTEQITKIVKSAFLNIEDMCYTCEVSVEYGRKDEGIKTAPIDPSEYDFLTKNDPIIMVVLNSDTSMLDFDSNKLSTACQVAARNMPQLSGIFQIYSLKTKAYRNFKSSYIPESVIQPDDVLQYFGWAGPVRLTFTNGKSPTKETAVGLQIVKLKMDYQMKDWEYPAWAEGNVPKQKATR